MDDPDFVVELDGIDDSKRIAAESQRHLKHARAEAMHRFRNVRFAAIRGDRKGREEDGLRAFGKALEFPSAPL